MKPERFSSGNDTGRSRAAKAYKASMKPERFSSGNAVRLADRWGGAAASMKPERFSSGNSESRPPLNPTRIGFNEAGAFQLRKHGQLGPLAAGHRDASMKPERFSSGNL